MVLDLGDLRVKAYKDSTRGGCVTMSFMRVFGGFTYLGGSIMKV
ncbi:MAG: hypothetical protein RMH77_06845 [Sulfolobales archaeon]|nr:hypothetical protein [Sulfolobales archaeon]